MHARAYERQVRFVTAGCWEINARAYNEVAVKPWIAYLARLSDTIIRRARPLAPTILVEWVLEMTTLERVIGAESG